MDDVLKRLGNLEHSVFDIRAQTAALAALVPHLATKADVQEVRAELQGVIRTEVQGVRTEIQEVRTEVQGVRTEVARLDGSLIRWLVGTLLAVAVLTFTVARFVKIGA